MPIDLRRLVGLGVSVIGCAAGLMLAVPRSAEAAGCFWPAVVTHPCALGVQINGGQSGGWVNTGSYNHTHTFNHTGGPRQLHTWFSTGSGTPIKAMVTIPAWWSAMHCKPGAGYVLTLLKNEGAYFAMANAYTDAPVEYPCI